MAQVTHELNLRSKNSTTVINIASFIGKGPTALSIEFSGNDGGTIVIENWMPVLARAKAQPASLRGPTLVFTECRGFGGSPLGVRAAVVAAVMGLCERCFRDGASPHVREANCAAKEGGCNDCDEGWRFIWFESTVG